MEPTSQDKRLGVAVGIDIGQRRDPTALCVAEIVLRTGPSGPQSHFTIRHLERLPLNTPYPEVAEILRDLIVQVVELTRERPKVFVDATGVGAPVVEILQAAAPHLRIIPVYFNHGDRRIAEYDQVRLGKAFLVSRLQVLLQTDRLRLAKTAEGEALAAELCEYEIRVTENANDTYGAFRVGTHDDLVTALGLAVQDDCKPMRSFEPSWVLC
jgi:hypothetical protein